MVNSKKMSKSSIAVIVLSILLVLSLILGFTGAWFTDKDAKGEQTVNFGTIDVALDETSDIGFKNGDNSTLTEPLMPGDKVMAKAVVKNTGAEAYYVVKILVSAQVKGAEEAATAKYYVWNGTETVEASETVMPKLKATTGTATIDLSMDLDGATYGNDYQGGKAVVSCEVRAIQAKNLTAAQAYKALVTSYSAENFTSGNITIA